MKHLFLALTLMLLMVAGVTGQTVVKDSTGVYTTLKAEKKPDKKTGEYFKTSKGEKFPIYVSSNGKYYVIRTSKKTGKQYKQYLKLEN